MKPLRNQLQRSVLKRLEAGLPLSRWQRFRLHLCTAWRYRHKLNLRKIWFHVKGVLRIFWKPFTLFSVGRVPVQWHLTCALYPLGLLARCNWYDHARETLMLALIFLPLMGGSVLLHEFAHVYAARCFGIVTRRVVFLPFGAVAELESMPSATSEFWIALAGPVASFILAGTFWWLAEAFREPGIPWRGGYSPVLTSGFILNLVLGLFNLLPCFPMDGGRILRSLLALTISHVLPGHSGRAFVIATRIAVRYVAWVMALGMIALTIMVTHLWLHLILFPLLLLVAEIEYWLLRTDDSPLVNNEPRKCSWVSDVVRVDHP